MPGFDKNRVYEAMLKIPRGRVTSYGEIARYLGTKAYRAVGAAAASNPHAPEVPCHRVVNSDGKIGGYSGTGGIRSKIKLLKTEGVRVENGRIADLKEVFFRLNDS